ncbi:sulfurtransferase-like selenium metabolism protein YedF [Desulfotomaculum copahuensis]|uniref:Preprotein translocase subunit TatB n=1 Tax=Desulfotomaculum copahuensis TaxID=1838280 RepID=A0A1B7LHV6_9FIRM|nr:sulfurtransferase-like selenium metabolism protein YedF [Desulfotomaculum copahuensis]OAT85783.1 preprotein translocase subunit TatB [Desulfotomaculum copahuensis]
MTVVEIDCRGLACPQPVLKAKKALDEISAGKVTVIVDNTTSRENVTMFAQNAGHRVEAIGKDGNYILTITKGETSVAPQAGVTAPGDVPAAAPGNTVETVRPAGREGNRPLVYLFSSNLFGQGAPDLGTTLLKSLFTTLVEMEPPPDTLIFLNSGVFLACAGSPVLEQLRVLAGRNTEMLVCGTCLNYYKLQEKLQAGRVSNMLEINERLTGAGRLVPIA